MDDTSARMRENATDVGRGSENTRGNAVDEGRDVDDRTREIRTEIEETRVEMSGTIDAIQEKLKPRNIVANATDRVKSAAGERVREMADTANQTASGMNETLRQNPIPFALMGVGAAWLLARSRRSAHGGGYRLMENERGYGRGYGETWTRDDMLYGNGGDEGLMATIRHNPVPAALACVGLGWLAFSGKGSGEHGYAERWDDRSDDPAGRSSMEGASGIGRNLTESASQVASRTREYASEATGSMRRMAQQRRSQLQSAVEDNPLIVGAGALMLGLAFGMAVPETEAENELMGEARENVMGRAREMAQGAASQVQDAAGTIADAAAKVAGRQQE